MVCCCCCCFLFSFLTCIFVYSMVLCRLDVCYAYVCIYICIKYIHNIRTFRMRVRAYTCVYVHIFVLPPLFAPLHFDEWWTLWEYYYDFCWQNDLISFRFQPPSECELRSNTTTIPEPWWRLNGTMRLKFNDSIHSHTHTPTTLFWREIFKFPFCLPLLCAAFGKQ